MYLLKKKNNIIIKNLIWAFKLTCMFGQFLKNPTFTTFSQQIQCGNCYQF